MWRSQLITVHFTKHAVLSCDWESCCHFHFIIHDRLATRVKTLHDPSPGETPDPLFFNAPKMGIEKRVILKHGTSDRKEHFVTGLLANIDCPFPHWFIVPLPGLSLKYYSLWSICALTGCKCCQLCLLEILFEMAATCQQDFTHSDWRCRVKFSTSWQTVYQLWH